MTKQPTKATEIIRHSELDEPTTICTPVLVDRVSIYTSDDLVVMSFEIGMPDQDCRIELCRLAMSSKIASSICKSLAALNGELNE